MRSGYKTLPPGAQDGFNTLNFRYKVEATGKNTKVEKFSKNLKKVLQLYKSNDNIMM